MDPSKNRNQQSNHNIFVRKPYRSDGYSKV